MYMHIFNYNVTSQTNDCHSAKLFYNGNTYVLPICEYMANGNCI